MKFRNSRGKNNCMAFNKNNNSDHICELLKMQLESRSRNVHLGGPVAGSFQHTLWPSERAEEHNEIFSELQYFGPDLRLARTKTAIPIRSLKNADCWLQTGYKMQTENLYCFFVWYVITCHLTTSVMFFRDHLSRLFALLWNILCPFRDHSHS